MGEDVKRYLIREVARSQGNSTKDTARNLEASWTSKSEGMKKVVTCAMLYGGGSLHASR